LQQPAERQNRLNLSEDEGCWNKMCIQVKHAASNTAQNISWDHHSVSFSLDMLSSSKRWPDYPSCGDHKKLKQKWTHDIKDSIPKFFPNHLRRSATRCMASGARSHELLISCLVLRYEMSWLKFEFFFCWKLIFFYIFRYFDVLITNIIFLK
jgi:hypothetical protein